MTELQESTNRVSIFWSRYMQLMSELGINETLARTSVHTAFPTILRQTESEAIDWSQALMLASFSEPGAPEEAQSVALRICQSCLQSLDSTDAHRAAAAYLLRRSGNRRAVELAVRKDLLADEQGLDLTGPLDLDLNRRALSHQVLTESGPLNLNEFQLAFWSAASRARQVSVSAPTSVGKSHVIKEWLKDRATRSQSFTGVYLVPTRALIEEVSADLEATFGELAAVVSLPWDARIETSQRTMLVLTQERLHLLQQRIRPFPFEIVVVDEAQKFGDGARGVLLQRVLDQALSDSPDAQLLFASPLTTNPGLLVDPDPDVSSTILSEVVTVNQNLVYVDQRRGKATLWDARTLVDGESVTVGTFTLPARPTSPIKRLSFVAAALGRAHAANVVYVNGASEAEKVAGQIFDALGSEFDIGSDQDIIDLQELIQKTVHPRYLLHRYLARGVAFHYGNMPLLLRQDIERLFRRGTIKYLVCTSTLLEGVNLPCQNLFVRAPRKGNNHPMTMGDFWNLAGRAGRWGVEFQGNIVCVDTAQDGTWREVPGLRARQPIVRSTDRIRDEYGELLGYLERGTPAAESSTHDVLEAAVSMLASNVARGSELDDISWLDLEPAQRQRLLETLSGIVQSVGTSPEVWTQHAGISPISIGRLADYIRSYESDADNLRIFAPENSDAVESFVRVISRVVRNLGGGFSTFPKRQFMLALLMVDWARGMPLSVLIAKRIRHLERTNQSEKLPTTIRNVMRDVEQHVRFEGPLYFSCYQAVLSDVRPELFEHDQENIPDIAMMLELGVSRTTELSTMSLGISRTSAVALAEYITADDFSREQCLEWLQGEDLEALGLPRLVVAEVERAIRRTQGDAANS